jgi:hypothetical protein
MLYAFNMLRVTKFGNLMYTEGYKFGYLKNPTIVQVYVHGPLDCFVNK